MKLVLVKTMRPLQVEKRGVKHIHAESTVQNVYCGFTNTDADGEERQLCLYDYFGCGQHEVD